MDRSLNGGRPSPVFDIYIYLICVYFFIFSLLLCEYKTLKSIYWKVMKQKNDRLGNQVKLAIQP